MTAFPPGRLHCRQTDGSHQEYQTMRRAERKNALPALFMRYRLRRANRLLPHVLLPSPPRKPFAPARSVTVSAAQTVCSRKRLHPQFLSNLGHEKRPCTTQSLFLVRSTGIAPLAARPGAQPTGLMRFAPARSVTISAAQTVCSRTRLHPQFLSNLGHEKRPCTTQSLFLVRSTGIEPAWCEPQDP